MALINKLFPSRKKAFNKHQDVCERKFTFSKDQVRLVLFRECDFRGRKLLFDSQSVQKIPLPLATNKHQNQTASPHLNKTEIYVEISNGYGYQYSRPSSDILQLGEMVFGSVAMSFRGTSLKIHSFTSPPKLMCTQVFPSPRHPIRGRISVTSQHFDALKSNSSIQSLEKSGKFDNSSASSTTSFNEQISLHSTESDVKIKTANGSVPLDVPASNQSMTSTKLAPSLEGDSGFCGEQSYSSISSGPPSMSLWDTRHDHASIHGFSCGSLYKRWLRSASTSLDYNACSDSSLSAGVQSSASADECMTRGNRSSKLGLAVIIHLSEGQEVDLERFLLEHSALIEAMVCRARSGAESAYTKPGSFASLMYEVFKETSQWLVDLITGPTINTYLWHILGQRSKVKQNFDCDNQISGLIKSDINKTKSESSLVKTYVNSDRTKNNLLFSSSLLDIDSKAKTFDTSLRRSILKPLTNDIFSNNDKLKSARVNPNCTNEASLNAEKFLRELCELLESLDTKHTNFFISTLMTAVLTHHLGWVSTVLLPSQSDKDTVSQLHSPCNPLWGQLSDLYGAVGSPTKIARTIICGNTKGQIISKILYTLTYFIRCSIIERNTLSRYSPEDENKEADTIFEKDELLLKNNKDFSTFFKKDYNVINTGEELEMSTLNLNKVKKNDDCCEQQESLQKNKSIGLTRTKSCLGSLKKQNSIESEIKDKTKHPLLDKVTSLGLSAANVELNDNFNLLNYPQENENLIDIKEASVQIKKVFHSKSNLLHKEKSFSNISKLVEYNTSNEIINDNKSNVIFVLGDNEKLIGLKKNQTNNNDIKKKDNNEIYSSNTHLNIPSCSNERPKDLNIPMSNKKLFQCDSSDTSPDITSPTCLHSSSSDTSPCSECEKNQRDLKFPSKTSPTNLKNNENKIVMTRSSVINLESENDNKETEKIEVRRREEYNRSQSVPPSDKTQRKCSKNGCKKKYSGVKFDFKQYPQIVTNYMKSKNLEMSQLPFEKLNRSFSVSLYDCSKFDFPTCDCEPHSEETLQTPSNATELEFSSELCNNEKYEFPKKFDRKIKSYSKTSVTTNEDDKKFNHPLQENFNKENNAIFEHDIDTYEGNASKKESDKMAFVELPMPRIITQSLLKPENTQIGYTKTLLRGVNDRYISDMVLQGTLSPPKSWEHILRRDLVLAARKPVLDQPVQEAVAIVANTDTWEVQLVSSHTYVVEKGSTFIRVGMSQLVANMLETLLHMWKLRAPPEYCLMHIESRLREFCIRSKALAQLLITTEFCNMDLLTSAMQLEVNDVPLLMAVASTHTPEVTQKYGLSFQ